ARVVPLYSIATMLVFILVSFCPSLFKNTVGNIEALFKSLFFIPYRIESTGPLLSLGWTLNYEMFFYFLMWVCISFKFDKTVLPIHCADLILSINLFFNSFETEKYEFLFYADGIISEFVMGIVLFYFWKLCMKESS